MWAVARLAPTVSFQEQVTLVVVHPVLLNALGTYEIGAFTKYLVNSVHSRVFNLKRV